jgi:hypothetical protein
MPIVSEAFWDHYTLTRFPSLDAVEALHQGDAWHEANVDRIKAPDRIAVVAANPVDLG